MPLCGEEGEKHKTEKGTAVKENEYLNLGERKSRRRTKEEESFHVSAFRLCRRRLSRSAEAALCRSSLPNRLKKKKTYTPAHQQKKPVKVALDMHTLPVTSKRSIDYGKEGSLNDVVHLSPSLS